MDTCFCMVVRWCAFSLSHCKSPANDHNLTNTPLNFSTREPLQMNAPLNNWHLGWCRIFFFSRIYFPTCQLFCCCCFHISFVCFVLFSVSIGFYSFKNVSAASQCTHKYDLFFGFNELIDCFFMCNLHEF